MNSSRKTLVTSLLALGLLLAGVNATLAAGIGRSDMEATWRYRILEGSLGPSTGVCGSTIAVHATLQTDSGTGGASWVPAVGKQLEFTLRATDPASTLSAFSAPTDANGQATASITVPDGAVQLWVEYEVSSNWIENLSIAFNTPALTLTVSDATYDGNPHGAIAIVADSCGVSQRLPVTYSGRDLTPYPQSETAPTNAGLYDAQAVYFEGPYFFFDYKPYTIAKAPASVTPDSFTRQYGDQNPTFTGTLSGFLARDGMTARYNTPAPPASAPGDYPIAANLGPNSTPGLGNYVVTYNTGALRVIREEAHVSFDPANPAVLQASTPGGALSAGALTLRVHVQELPDLPEGTAMAGDINQAGLVVTLTPSTGPTLALNCSAPAAGAGYAIRTFSCINGDAIPVGACEVTAAVTGDFYVGAGADVFTVDDPISGFATGGGWFYWPGTSDKTNFGFTTKYNKSGANLKGSLLVIRHHQDGKISRFKSAVLDELKLRNVDGCSSATFSGKGTYRTWDLAAGGNANSGGNAFSVYAEDCNNPGSGVDSFWISSVGNLALPTPAPSSKVQIGGGNIVVPHTAEK
jgi:hypothetical protein